MPTSTYYNLDSLKKDKIERAVKKEFSRVPLMDMSVKNIVTDAKIARGSFYQYFETREDLILYMLQKEFEHEEIKFLEILENTNKDIFEASYKYLERILEKQEKNSSYYINIFQYLNETKIYPLKKICADNIKDYVDIVAFNIITADEIYAAIRVIATITHSKKMDILNGKLSKKEGLKEYKQELEIIKKGMTK